MRFNRLRKTVTGMSNLASLQIELEKQSLLIGQMLTQSSKHKKHVANLREVEFKVFSQWGDDGIIQWLVNNLEFPNKTFIEFGVGNYRESNTRFLMMNNNWSGLVMDGSEANIAQIVNSEYFWQYDLQAKAAFITKDNINSLVQSAGFDEEVGILHIDLDGNDYWIWKTLNVIRPIVVILEYNSVFGIDRAITVPYAERFVRQSAHHTCLYAGASLRALDDLSKQKGYRFVGSNSAGNNAYFVRQDKLTADVKAVVLEQGYVHSKFRESRNKDGDLSYLAGEKRLDALKGLPVTNVYSGLIEPL